MKLTLYHIILTIINLEKGGLIKKKKKNILKNENILVTAFFPFHKMCLTLPRINFNVSVTCYLLSANALNLDQFKKLLFCKEINTIQSINSYFKPLPHYPDF